MLSVISLSHPEMSSGFFRFAKLLTVTAAVTHHSQEPQSQCVVTPAGRSAEQYSESRGESPAFRTFICFKYVKVTFNLIS